MQRPNIKTGNFQKQVSTEVVLSIRGRLSLLFFPSKALKEVSPYPRRLATLSPRAHQNIRDKKRRDST